MEWFVVGIWIGIGLCIWALLRLAEAGWVIMGRRGKVRLFFLDPDGCGLRQVIGERKGNEVQVGKGEGAKRYVLDGAARLAYEGPNAYGDTGPAWILHPRHGWNLAGPRDEEALRKPDGTVDRRRALMTALNPETYLHAFRSNVARATIKANQKDDSWIVKVAPFALAALVICTFGVIYLVVKLGKSGAIPGLGG